MKRLSFRLPDDLVAEITAEARNRRVSKSAVMRERLERSPAKAKIDPLASIRDLIGSIDGLPEDLSSRKKEYLRAWGYGRKRGTIPHGKALDDHHKRKDLDDTE
jgi:hypothetical protein